MESEEHKFCEYCESKAVPASNFRLHQLGCQRDHKRKIKEDELNKIELGIFNGENEKIL